MNFQVVGSANIPGFETKKMQVKAKACIFFCDEDVQKEPVTGNR